MKNKQINILGRFAENCLIYLQYGLILTIWDSAEWLGVIYLDRSGGRFWDCV